MIAWTDPVHFGQVVLERDLDTFSERRVAVLSSFGWDEDGVMSEDFSLRNEEFERFLGTGEQVVLLFGPSIRDQLQLSQICDYLSTASSEVLDCIAFGLSDVPIESNAEACLEALRNLSADPFGLLIGYRDLWRAYAGGDPRFLEQFYRTQNDERLKYIASRVLRKYPSAENGLSLGDTQILDALSLGLRRPQELFDACQETEAFAYATNWEFWSVLHRLCAGLEPFVKVLNNDRFLCPPKDLAWDTFYSQELVLTEKGERAASPEQCYADSHYPNRWIGGVRLHQNNRWYWDYEAGQLVRMPRTRELAMV